MPEAANQLEDHYRDLLCVRCCRSLSLLTGLVFAFATSQVDGVSCIKVRRSLYTWGIGRPNETHDLRRFETLPRNFGNPRVSAMVKPPFSVGANRHTSASDSLRWCLLGHRENRLLVLIRATVNRLRQDFCCAAVKRQIAGALRPPCSSVVAASRRHAPYCRRQGQRVGPRHARVPPSAALNGDASRGVGPAQRLSARPGIG